MSLGPVVSESDRLTPVVDDEAAVAAASGKAIEGRSLGRIAWNRLKKDRIALGGAIVVVVLVLIAAFAPLIVKVFGHPPNEYHDDQLDVNLGGLPKGSWGGVNSHFLLGMQPATGRDVFSQVVYGARISLLVAFLATVVAVVIGVVMGVIAGYFGGWIDALISRVMDIFLAFPLLLFAIALISVLPQGNSYRIGILIFIIGFFSWPYIGRIIRGQTLSLREREFVEAARSIGSRSPRILFRELLPNLAAPILVYGTLIIPTNILFEAALTFLGVGVQAPTPSWGKLLSDAVDYYEADPLYMIVPGLAIFVTVLAFNLFGDGLRDALDPKASR
jgi:ABC-type dipeptide/oligopeptide/nickel transport system permease subunit